MSDDEKPDMEDEDKDPAAEDDKPAAEDDVAEDDDKSAEGDDPDKEDEETAEDDASDKDMSAPERKAFAKGRTVERKRIGAILGSKHAEANPSLAAHLAFQTADGAKKALATLQHGGTSANAGGLSNRMNARGLSRTGRGGETDVRTKNADSSWDGALARAGKLKGK
jgi:hypothetical protein